MSLLSTVLSSKVIQVLEKVLIANEPEIQAAILDELGSFSTMLAGWLESKLAAATNLPSAATPTITPAPMPIAPTPAN